MQAKKYWIAVLGALYSFSVCAASIGDHSVEETDYVSVNDNSISLFNNSPIPSSTGGASYTTVYSFGGVYQTTPHGCRVNQVTGSCGCPSGFSARAYGIYDSNFVYCIKAITVRTN